MKAPEKLYLGKNIYNTFVYQVPDDDDKTQVEYVRMDAFIEKACEWLKSNLYNYAGEDDKRNIVPFDNAIFHDFKKAMEE